MKDLVKRRRRTRDRGASEGPGEPADSSPGRPRALGAEPRADGDGQTSRSVGCRINPTVSTAVIAEARNALEAAHTSGDYRYQSIGDLIRAALLAYSAGLQLTQQARGGRKKRHTVELQGELVKRYKALPNRSRGEILERALISFLAQGF